MKKQVKKFLKSPEFPGGKEMFKAYVKKHLRYPEAAIEAQKEGIVFLSAQIDDNGNVCEVHIEKGLGFGCDEEALRLIESVRFGAVKNKGIRVKARRQFRIEFKLPPNPQKINYQIKNKPPQDKSKPDTSVTIKYSYSLNIEHKNQ